MLRPSCLPCHKAVAMVRRRRDIDRAKQQWQTFMAAAPPYPEGVFRGRGIAILAGGGQYMVPAWVNIHMLRRTGRCDCPPTASTLRSQMVLHAAFIHLGCLMHPVLHQSNLMGCCSAQPLACTPHA